VGASSIDSLGDGRRSGPRDAIALSLQPSRRASSLRTVLSLGLYEFWRRGTYLLLTDHDVILVKGLLARLERRFPISSIRAMSVINGGNGSALVLDLDRFGIQRLRGFDRDEMAVFGRALASVLNSAPISEAVPRTADRALPRT
jgi:hypothetical protein